MADAHLAAKRPADEEAFLAFLDAMPSLGDSLLLAGDIYDFWFTYKRLIPRDCIRVTARLVELARHLPVWMIGGNHDRWGDTFWGRETGIQFDRRELHFPIGRHPVIAIHGDGIHEERPSAGALNRILDRPAVIAGFDLLPPIVGFTAARRLGHDPAFASNHPDVVEQAVRRQAEWAARRLRDEASGAVLVMGHTHRPALHEVDGDRWYVNPGAWLAERRFAIIDDSAVRLESFG
ncbi:MAG: UDP-2,3-diacylglucosamine diphosphatase [Gemmatimonadales bacterium]